MQGLARGPGIVVGAVDLFEATEKIGQRNSGFHAGKRRAEAEVNAVAKSKVGIGSASDVEAVHIRKDFWVAIGGTDDGEDEFAGGNRLAAHLEVAFWGAHDPLERR